MLARNVGNYALNNISTAIKLIVMVFDLLLKTHNSMQKLKLCITYKILQFFSNCDI